MSGRDDNAQGSADEALDEQVRSHFAAARQGVPVPAFDAVMAQAEASANEARVPVRGRLEELFHARRSAALWAASAAVACTLVIYVLLAVGERQGKQALDEAMLARLPEAVSVSEQELVADLNNSTRWHAPSDRWPMAEPDLDVFSLPDLGNSATGQQEKTTWL